MFDLTASITAGLGFSLDFLSLPQQIVNGITLGAIYALIALGYTMVYGVLRLINFAHGEVFMLGGYTALFVSYALGFRVGPKDSHPVNLLIMILAAMAVCAIIGAIIEFFAYRPMRNQSRVAALITAIGVSLFLQYAGQLFLPSSPPPSIIEDVNPYRSTISLTLKKAPEDLRTVLASAQEVLDKETTEFDAVKENFTFDDVEYQDAQKEFMAAELAVNQATGAVQAEESTISLTQGKLIMLSTVVVLMLILRWLVMATPAGRAMRAVSHDFDSASLMGINVNKTVTFTFMLGSALAGAGAMMLATFEGTPLNPFFGLQPGVKAFVAAVLGGIGNIPGAVLGGFLMGLAESLVTWLGYSQYKDAVAFVVLIIVLLFRPGGILGSSKVEKV